MSAETTGPEKESSATDSLRWMFPRASECDLLSRIVGHAALSLGLRDPPRVIGLMIEGMLEICDRLDALESATASTGRPTCADTCASTCGPTEPVADPSEWALRLAQDSLGRQPQEIIRAAAQMADWAKSYGERIAIKKLSSGI